MTPAARALGNLSRTHHPCGPCGALVETCGHWRAGYVAPPSNARRARAKARAEAMHREVAAEAERLQLEQQALIRSFATDTMGAPP